MKTFAYDEKYFHGLVTEWNARSFPLISAIVRRTMERFRPREVLDYGCGSGTYAKLISSYQAEVDGCDVSEASVTECIGKYRDLFLLTSSHLPKDESYDMVFSSEVIEHIDDYRRAIAEFYRLLRPGGVVLLTTTCYAPSLFTMLYAAKNTGQSLRYILTQFFANMKGYLSEERRDAFVFKWCFMTLGGHYHGFVPRHLARQFKAAGFSVRDLGVFYAFEAIQMPFLHEHSAIECLQQQDWHWRKRFLAFMMHLFLNPLNAACKRTQRMANNLFLVAQK